MKNNLYPIVVLIGGNGSNLQALIDYAQQNPTYQIAGVISHRPAAYGLTRAALADIPTVTVDHRAYEQRRDFEQVLHDAIHTFQPKLVLLAGFMRILSGEFVAGLGITILNIHPSLLPKYKGLDTHARAIAAGDLTHGVSIHVVTDELDGGPIIAQAAVPILEGDTPIALQERVFIAEHWLYPQIVSHFSRGHLNYNQNTVTLEGKRLGPQGMQLTPPLHKE